MNQTRAVDQLRSIADGKLRNPGFVDRIIFSYYDGPEDGLALYSSGEGVRFSSLGDEDGKYLRAFKLDALDGNWLELVHKAKVFKDLLQSCNVVRVTEQYPFGQVHSSKEFHLLIKAVLSAPSTGLFLGLGKPSLAELAIAPVTLDEIEVLQAFSHPMVFYGYRKIMEFRARDIDSRAPDV